ncbi:MAG: carboxylating nicotinate-nucleotide diphosphorylase [archaeon]|nr:carboxylating nicotinate-nucleotide diphosphorylase [archaeon]
MLSKEIKQELEHYLKQDVGKGDVTTNITPQKNCEAIIKTNENCIVVGIEEISYLFRSRGLKVKPLKKDGQKVNKGTKIIIISGSNKKILTLERICLNILGRMSGVATLASEAKSKSKAVSLTRKTIPGFQMLDKKAGETIGIWSHRKNLNEMVLLKENHLNFFAGIGEAVRKAKKTGKKVEVEVETEAEAIEAVWAKPSIIMLDNFSPKKAKATIKLLKGAGFQGKIELSGGITLKNLSKYSNLGADIISMGELTKNAKIIDFSLEMKK